MPPRYRMATLALGLLPGCVDAYYAKFNEAFTSSMLDKVASEVALPWTPLDSIAAAFSSYEIKSSDATSVNGEIIMDDNATASTLWMLMKPYAERTAHPIDALYAGFENAKLVMYLRNTAYPKRPMSRAYSRDENYTCFQNDTQISGCYVQWDNATDPVTGAREGSPTGATSFDCRVRQWYKVSKASTNVVKGASGPIWSDPFLLIQTGTLGLAAARQLVTKDGAFVGVAGVDFELSTIETLLQDTTDSSGGTLTVFVVDSVGKMISSSVRDTVLTADGTAQVLAANSTHRIIRTVGQEVDARGGWATTAGQVITIDVTSLGLYWFQHLNLTDGYGLKWHVVVAQVVLCDRGYFASLTLPEDGTGKECLPCPEGAICSGGTTMPFPKAGWWIDRASYETGGAAFPCFRGTCDGFQARAKGWAKTIHASGNDFDFGGLSTLDGGSNDINDDAVVANDDYVGLSGISLDPLACWHRAAFVNASEAAYMRSLQSSEEYTQLMLPQCADFRLMCKHGSVGPLCGACEEGFVFSTSVRHCVNCKKPISFIPPLILGILLILALVMRSALIKARKQRRHEPLRKRLSRLCPTLFSDAPLSSKAKHKTWNPFRHLDRGMLKVSWATFQILNTISWNLAIRYPEPFASALELLDFMSLDFSTSLTCSSQMNVLDRTLFAALAPLVLLFLDLAIYFARSTHRRAVSEAALEATDKERAFRPSPEFISESNGSANTADCSFPSPTSPSEGFFWHSIDRARRFLGYNVPRKPIIFDHHLEHAIDHMHNQHVFFALVLSYLVLPPAALLQFHALDCVNLSTPADYFIKHGNVLRVDTSVDCDSTAYKNFLIANCMLIVIYQSIPLVWFCLLWRVRHLLNPMGYDKSLKHPEVSALVAKNDSGYLGASDEMDDSGRKSGSYWFERFSQSISLRSSVSHLRSSGASIFGKKKLTKKELIAKEQLRLNTDKCVTEHAVAEAARKKNKALRHLSFLWDDYKSSAWYYEVVEIYRRMLFAAALPDLAPQGLQRAALGCLLATLAVAVVREASPFQREATNVLLVLSQYQILLTFLSAFVVESDTLESVRNSNELLLGLLLCVVNAGVLFAAGLILLARYRVEREQRKWRRPRTPQELALLEQLLGKATTLSYESPEDNGNEVPTQQNNQRQTLKGGIIGVLDRNIGSTKRAGQAEVDIELTAMSTDLKEEQLNIRENATKVVLARHLLKADDVELTGRIGAGAFGEVFRGMCLGQAVAVKTMLDVTEENVQAFRDEILLTAMLRHPNIVNFVGACWGEDLTCLVLEWVPKGSLQQLLHDEALDLRWGEPLLRLASDVSRGMAYLHGREYMDETDQNKLIRCILHRDLKPDNVLITEFLRAKLSDFGTSCAQGVESDDVTKTAVGTPLFCAPEIMRGEAYDASVDVYSYGFLLLAMVVKDELIDFVGESWRLYHGKKKKPVNSMRIIRTIAEDGWRPVVAQPLPDHPDVLASEIAQLAPRADHLTLMERRRLDALNNALSQARTEQAPPTTSNGADSAPIVLSDAPPTIVRLLVECMLEDPSQRPTFEDCMRELEGPAQREVAAMEFSRTSIAACMQGGAAPRGMQIPEPAIPSSFLPRLGPDAANNKFEESRMAARDAHLLRSSMAFRANHPSSVQAHSTDQSDYASTPVANPLDNESRVSPNAALVLPLQSNDLNNHRYSAAAAPTLYLGEGLMRNDGRPREDDFSSV